jgi:hypothetical protein
MKTQADKLDLTPDQSELTPDEPWGSMARVGRTWNGPTTTKNGKSRFDSFWSVLTRDGNKATLLHNGAGAKKGGWQVEVEFVSANEFRVVAAKQLVGKPYPFGEEIAGTGTLDGESLTIDLWFPTAKHGSVFVGKPE